MSRNSDDFIPIYRGLRGGDFSSSVGPSGAIVRGAPEGISVNAEEVAKNFISGNFYIGGGAGGNGAYFTPNRSDAAGYAVGLGAGSTSSQPGAIIDALLPKSARIADFGDPSLRLAFEQSGFPDFSSFLASLGYEAIKRDDIYVILNRSALRVLANPEIVTKVSPATPPVRRYDSETGL